VLWFCGFGIEDVVEKLIFGLGKTGFSCASYFERSGVSYSVVDDDPNPQRLSALRKLNPAVPFSMVDETSVMSADEIVVSPGVPLSLPLLKQAKASGIAITGDVAMFGQLAEAPIALITGSNGKSTVTELLGHLAAAQQSGVRVGGNLGTPCLDLLSDDASLYILEVSSYQLELATSLPAAVSVVLNLSPDHEDRYESNAQYYATKMNVYRNCKVALVNRDVDVPALNTPNVVSFGTDVPTHDIDFGVKDKFLVRGDERLIALDELPLEGRHNMLNCMAALALGESLNLNMSRMLNDLSGFVGLQHRCERVGSIGGVDVYNDSKATNVASTLAAITSFGDVTKNVVLILGGEGKNADFSLLRKAAEKYLRHAVVFGKDQGAISQALADACPLSLSVSLDEALELALNHAQRGNVLLFSPACASFDMFENYSVRGDAFKSLVMELMDD
jgi:UDP-N-acetylmuramoylalanine--D-glutamate ligase